MDADEGRTKKKGFAEAARLAAALAVMLALGFAGGLSVGASGTDKVFSAISFFGDGLDATPDESADLTDFWKAWNTLDARFVETHASSTLPDAREKIWGAIQGLAGSYGDPYTVFMPPQEAKVFQEDISGNFEGVGMEIGIKDGVLTVIAPLKGTPAEQAGILAGDAILAIDGASTEGLSSDQAVKRIRGPKGSTVTFRVLRAGELLEINVVRDTIQVPTIDHAYDASNGVYTISIYSFTANSGKLFTNALKDFRASGSSRLLIDVRGNPGGYLEAAVSMASHFLPEGEPVVTEDYKGKRQNIVHRSTGVNDVPKNVRTAILIDQGSASASEILAGALQDNERAILIGTRSFGKGSVQELVDINGGALKVTVARWLTPADRSISDGGLTADIQVERTSEDYAAGKDPQKDRAIEYLTTGR
ncbi:MAG TPA: S41 family peptidase [Candidatus Paceibacterota bacterium]|nr:S41 family peptidase [Candidatus Paceibacterota bacterium]